MSDKIEILKYGQPSWVSKRDRLFLLNDSKGLYLPVIVVNYYGSILLGRTEDARFLDLNSVEKIKEYIFYAFLDITILEEIVEVKDVEKAMYQYYKKIPDVFQSYLIPANIKRLQDIISYYYIVTKPKKYILVSINTYEGKDEIKIESLESKKDAKIRIKILHRNIDYFGPELDLNSKFLYDLDIIVTNDERMSGKYRCVLTHDEFKELCREKTNQETIEYFEKVWNGEIGYAQKYWTYETYKHMGEYIYGDDYPKWSTSTEV